jgi:glycosyltransferase involved in cell wall biosynthesis
LNILLLTGEAASDKTNLELAFPNSHITSLAKSELTASSLTDCLSAMEGEHLLLVDASAEIISFKKSAKLLYELVAETEDDWSMIYADYEVEAQNAIQDEHLLEHHIGRVRDNTDYGKVWFLNLAKVKEILPLASTTKQHFLYELRLRFSEVGELVHIANRYSGAPYRTQKAVGEQNVFDYLLATKESQLELELILTDHLRRIGAYLKPGKFYSKVPYAKKAYERVASVIIPVNNRPEFIGSAIESILEQTIQNIEVIVVVNGGDEDPTIPAVKQYLPGGSKYNADKPAVHLVVLDINNIGLCLNAGLQQAKGKYYVQLDSDDQLTPDAVEKITAVYESDDTIGMVIGSYEVWEKDMKTGDLHRMESIPVVTHDEWTEENGRNNLLRINGAGAPRSFYIEAARDLGYLDMNTSAYARNYGEDYDFVTRMSEHHRIGRVWDPVYKVVRHGGGTDHNIDRSTVDRNNNAKDEMRRNTIYRRQIMNEVDNG